jgi:choline-sulfatase
MAANVLFILTDDQGPWAMGCAGNAEIRTPNLDRLAATGVRFEHFLCASPVCSPSRASFLTGRMPSQHGVHDWIRQGNVGDTAARYLEGEVAYTDVLADAGYTVGLSGKWHLGHSMAVQHGHAHWYVHQQGGGPYNDAPMIRDGELITEPGYVTTNITDDALRFLDEHASAATQATPFYLGVHYTAPHSPWTGHPQEIVDSYDDCAFDSCPQESIHEWAKGHGLSESCLGNREMLKGYFAAVTAMDHDVGRLLDKLESLGLREETLVVFVSDNGFSCGHHGFWGKGNGTFPLNFYENSVTVPFLISQPGGVPQGVVESGLHGACDWFPTLTDYLGLDAPPVTAPGGDRPGRSFAGLLRADAGAPGHEALVVDGAAGLTPSQYAEYGAGRMVRTEGWKYVDRGDEQPGELYHLAEDPDERHNLIDDAAGRTARGELHGVLHDWFARYGAGGERDGRRWEVTGGGQLRPVGGEREQTDRPAFTTH